MENRGVYMWFEKYTFRSIHPIHCLTRAIEMLSRSTVSVYEYQQLIRTSGFIYVECIYSPILTDDKVISFAQLFV